MRPPLLFYVQHLLGIGHLVRAGRIAEALSGAFEVTLVVGGALPPDLVPPGLAVVTLPPVRAGAGGFGALAHLDGTPFDALAEADRRDRLLALFDDVAPAVLLVEAFPFGRRQMRFELIPLLDRAVASRRRPLIACSVRDILQDVRPPRAAETVGLVARYFDLVLVHGDSSLAVLEDSFPDAAVFSDKVRYTGLVGPLMRRAAPDELPDSEVFDVVVSAGGGAVGARLLATALAARASTRLAAARWLVLAGPNAAGSPTSPDPRVAVRTFVPDLPARLARAKVSVSQAGYNTVADLIAARCRAVLVPYAAGGETEQTRRATLLAARGSAITLRETDLDATSLARGVDAALDLPDGIAGLPLDGADATARILRGSLDPR